LHGRGVAHENAGLVPRYSRVLCLLERASERQ